MGNNLCLKGETIFQPRLRPVKQRVPAIQLIQKTANFSDQFAQNHEQSLQCSLMKIRRELSEVPINRSDRNSDCSNCEMPIPKLRLAAKPHARRCIPCQTAHEEKNAKLEITNRAREIYARINFNNPEVF